MNFFKLYVGDYLRDTGTLTLAQHGAYLLMLLEAYATEKPLPTGKELHRLLRADSKSERDAIDSVAARFWSLSDGGLVNDRAIKEFARAGEVSDTNRAIALAREAKKREQREHEQSTKRAPGVPRNEHAKSTNQTPDTRQEKPEAIASSSPGATRPAERTPEIPCPYGQIVEAYHQALPELPRVRDIGDKRRRAMQGFWRWVLTSRSMDGERRATTGGEAIDYVRRYFGQAAENDFILGRRSTSGEHAGWKADIDFLLAEKGRKHVLERTAEAA